MDEETPVMETVSTVTIGGTTKEIADPVARAKTQALLEMFGESAESLLDFCHPVGSLYISYVSTSPASLFGGSWTQITGRFLRAANDTSTGGADTVTLTTAQMPSHTHGIPWQKCSGDASGYGLTKSSTFTDNVAVVRTNGSTSGSTGSGSSHSNMPSYQDVYVWRRTA